MKKEILPLGSVVLLNGGTKKVMIIGYCMKTPENPNKMYDYCGCVFSMQNNKIEENENR